MEPVSARNTTSYLSIIVPSLHKAPLGSLVTFLQEATQGDMVHARISKSGSAGFPHKLRIHAQLSCVCVSVPICF